MSCLALVFEIRGVRYGKQRQENIGHWRLARLLQIELVVAPESKTASKCRLWKWRWSVDDAVTIYLTLLLAFGMVGCSEYRLKESGHNMRISVQGEDSQRQSAWICSLAEAI